MPETVKLTVFINQVINLNCLNNIKIILKVFRYKQI